ncbi:hypothetical protein GCT13_47660 [Paraburkholderia sp. CNPSo 3157]|uniref:Uncharacterized protein n=1 Tax=Paraburkholderia franconis TaxID=2654983 RepID=A0A7X1NLH0_9BURK|nr:hypothetical protein [Paraburkholderia franconis]MPW24110.1 hypothetical protein [Paraburkholderia franconis]
MGNEDPSGEQTVNDDRLVRTFFFPAGPRYLPHFGGNMKPATAMAFLAACASLPIRTFAQQPPSDVDLRAAYCIPIVNQQVAVYQHALSSPGQPLPPQLEETIKNMAADAQDRADRLKRYLLPRMADLDATALLAASEQGKQDLQRGKQDVIQCMTFCQHDANPAACMSSCSTDTLTRVRRCTKLDWLPF